MKKSDILKALDKLNTKLAEQNIIGEIGIVGGAVMVLAFNARAATKDVDAIFEPSKKIRSAVKWIAAEMDLPEDWLNDAVKAFLPGVPRKKRILISKDHLKVWVPEPEYLLAMKGISARFDSRDSDDLKLLVKYLQLDSAKGALDIIQKYYPKEQIPAKTQFFIEELFE